MSTSMNTNINLNHDLIAYHANCIDGFTSAWVAHKALASKGVSEITLLPMQYNDDSYAELETLIGRLKPTSLTVVDFSLPLDILDALHRFHPNVGVTILDHHKTAYERYFPTINYSSGKVMSEYKHGAYNIIDPNKSGAWICWTHFFPEKEVPRIIKYVQDYDLWRFEYGEDTKYINMYLRQELKTKYPLKAWDEAHIDLENSRRLEHILTEGRKLLERFTSEAENISDKAAPIQILGNIGLTVNCPPEYASFVGNKLAAKCGSYGATFSIDIDNNEIKWSLRSIGEYDVTEIAEYYGGGGHKNAAGFTTPLIGPPVLKVMGEYND